MFPKKRQFSFVNDILKKPFSYASLIVVAMVKRFSLQIYLKQSCLEVIFSDCIFSQSININMLLQVVKKFPMQTEIVIQLWFSDNIRITNTHLTLKPEWVSSTIFCMSVQSKNEKYVIHICLIILNENNVSRSMILGTLCVTIYLRHHYHLLIQNIVTCIVFVIP